MKTKITLEKLFKSFLRIKWFMILTVFFLATSITFSQVAINLDDSPPDASAMLDVKATGLGFLVPRMLQSERPASPATGLIIYQTNSQPGYYYYDGAEWQQIGNRIWRNNGDDIYFNDGKVSIGNSSSDGHTLLVRNFDAGTATVYGKYHDGNFANGMLGVSNTGGNPIGLPTYWENISVIGVLGIKPASVNNIIGAGVFGWNNENADSNYGGIFVADGSGTGNNFAIYGYAVNGANNYAAFLNGRVKVTSRMEVAGTLQVGNATIPAGYSLSVDGEIACEEVFIALSADWPDYVFEENYPLLSIDEFEQSILENNHLPGMTSADDVENKGGHLIGDVQKKMLEKVEELSLYIIELNDRVKILENENQVLKEQIPE